MNNTKWINYLTEQQDFEDDKTDYGPEESFFNHNIKMLSKYVNTSKIEQWESFDLLDKIKIGYKIGQGSFGAVFDIENSSMVIKIFRGSYAMRGDQVRFEKIINQVYKGQATLHDMHVFEHGEVGSTGLFYAIMPKIIPITEAPFWNLSDIFEYVTEGNSFATLGMNNDEYFNFEYKKISYNKFYNLVTKFAIEEMSSNGGKDDSTGPQYELNKYHSTIGRIIQAGYRAYLEHDGEDLHAGNIGYLPQKPDVFFYFDM